jgi:hypothetical protein
VRGTEMDAARPGGDVTAEAGAAATASSAGDAADAETSRAAAAAERVVTFRDKSTYRSDPEYTASGVRQYVNDQLYPHLLAAMQAINTSRPLHPVMFMARCLLEGAIPDDEPTAGAPEPGSARRLCRCARAIS